MLACGTTDRERACVRLAGSQSAVIGLGTMQRDACAARPGRRGRDAPPNEAQGHGSNPCGHPSCATASGGGAIAARRATPPRATQRGGPGRRPLALAEPPAKRSRMTPSRRPPLPIWRGWPSSSETFSRRRTPVVRMRTRRGSSSKRRATSAAGSAERTRIAALQRLVLEHRADQAAQAGRRAADRDRLVGMRRSRRRRRSPRCGRGRGGSRPPRADRRSISSSARTPEPIVPGAHLVRPRRGRCRGSPRSSRRRRRRRRSARRPGGRAPWSRR